MSVKALEEAIPIRRQIDSLEKRLCLLFCPVRLHARATAGAPKRVSA